MGVSRLDWRVLQGSLMHELLTKPSLGLTETCLRIFRAISASDRAQRVRAEASWWQVLKLSPRSPGPGVPRPRKDPAPTLGMLSPGQSAAGRAPVSPHLQGCLCEGGGSRLSPSGGAQPPEIPHDIAPCDTQRWCCLNQLRSLERAVWSGRGPGGHGRASSPQARSPVLPFF